MASKARAARTTPSATRTARAARGERVEVACIGGIGRTGTVLGCMAVLAGVPVRRCTAWVREHYRSIAIETEQQNQFIVDFGG